MNVPLQMQLHTPGATGLWFVLEETHIWVTLEEAMHGSF